MAMTLLRRRALIVIFWANALIVKCSAYVWPTAVVDPSRVKQVSWKPRAFVYDGFLTDMECDHLIALAKPELRRSQVVDAENTARSKLSDVRTSSGMFVPSAKDSVVAGIEAKLAAWTFYPPENGEDIQVLRYEIGQKYDPHHDYFEDAHNLARGGNRVATVLMYLTNVTKGGETVFPLAEVPEGRNASEFEDLSECAQRGIAVKPKKGRALLFFSLFPNAEGDNLSTHGGCPVIEGEKWSATRWIHQGSFSTSDEQLDGVCKDMNDDCRHWASIGECARNPHYMVGGPTRPGHCRESCNVC